MYTEIYRRFELS